jgi:hypothetical protein
LNLAADAVPTTSRRFNLCGLLAIPIPGSARIPGAKPRASTVRLEQNPRGFLARMQALSCNWDNAAHRIVELLIVHEGMFGAYLQAIRDCANYDNANLLAEILPSIVELDDEQVAELVDAYNSNSQVYDSFGFNGLQRYTYGDGLLPHLHRLGSQRYEMSGRTIRPAAQTKRKRR